MTPGLGWPWSTAPITGRLVARLGIFPSGARPCRSCAGSYAEACWRPPAASDLASYLSDELGFGRLLDFGLIVPRLRQLYEWSAHELDAPGLLECARNGALTYAWPFEDRHVWVAGRSVAISMVRRAIPAVHRRQA